MPVEIHQATPANARLFFEPSVINTIDGKGRTVPPIKSQIPDFPASFIDFQTGLTSGGTFDAVFPVSTPGLYRRVGFSLLSNGVMKAIFSAEAATIGALANAGTVFVKGALPIGFVDVEATGATAFKTAGSATDVIEHKVGVDYRIFTFGSGGGGSGGEGDTTDFEQNLQRRLEDSYFGWVTPNIFAVQEETLIDPSTTAVFDIANSEFDFEAADILLSTQQYDARFLEEQSESKQIELHALWNADDDAAVYEVSKDGGTTFETITMERVGGSNKYRGVLVLAEPVGALQDEYNVSNADSIIELRGGLTPRTAMAVQLPAIAAGTRKRLSSVNVYLNKLGAPIGEILVKVVADNAGAPGTEILGQNHDVIAVSDLAVGDNVVSVDLSAILVEGTYWLVIEGAPSYLDTMSTGVNAVRVQVDTSLHTYSEGDSFENLSGVWQSVADHAVVFQTLGYNYDLRVRITASQASSLAAYGIFYGESAPFVYQKEQNIQRFDVDGSLDQTEFTITKFIPDPMKLRVYDVNSGQVYRFPAFAIDGRKVVFASGQFQAPGETIVLLFDQAEQGAFDNSDVNAAIIAANRLGSADPEFDRSVAGEGPLLRADNNKLVEVSLHWNGASYEWIFAELP